MISTFKGSRLTGPALATLLLISFGGASADTGDVFDLPGTGRACGPEVGPTVEVDFDDDGTPDTLVVVFGLTGETYIATDGNPPYNRTLYLTAVH